MQLRRIAALSILALRGAAPSAAALDETLYARLLDRHTRAVADVARTRVDYAAIAGSPDWRRLVRSLEDFDTSELRTREAKLAFWINVYNILAIDLVARHYPVESIRDIGTLWTPVWKQPAGVVGGHSVTLDQIEHEIVRPLGDPRTHAALICASTSCPALRREPWNALRLDAQLDDAMRVWMADPEKGLRVDRQQRTVVLSKVFDWFERDFESVGGALAFAARYAPTADREWLLGEGARARIRYFDYDWRVNATPTRDGALTPAEPSRAA